MQLLLSTLGIGVGFGAVNVNAGTSPDAGNLGLAAGAWWVISSCIALFFGGYAAAWLAGIEIRFDGVLHGLVTWGLATLLTIYLLTSTIGGVIGSGFSALSSITSAAGSGISDVAKPLAQSAGITPDVVQSQAQAFLQPSDPDPATMSSQDAQKEVAKNLLTYGKGGVDAAAAKERVIAIMAAQMKISHDDAAKRFEDAQAKLQQTKNQAIQTAKNAADATAAATSKSAFGAFAVLLLGAVAGAIGGSLAVQRRLQAVAHGIVR